MRRKEVSHQIRQVFEDFDKVASFLIETCPCVVAVPTIII